MRLLIFLLTLSFLFACSQTPKTNTNSNTNLAEKNKQTALRNDLVRLVQEAQKLEQEGRTLDIYRTMPSVANTEACLKAVGERSVRLEDFQKKSESLPDNYKTKLLPIYDDLNKCISCEKTALENCKKARANINEAIKEFFPQ